MRLRLKRADGKAFFAYATKSRIRKLLSPDQPSQLPARSSSSLEISEYDRLEVLEGGPCSKNGGGSLKSLGMDGSTTS